MRIAFAFYPAMTVSANRRTPLQARSNQTVEEILDAASSLLGRVPFEEITTSRIAAQAGISVGALYRFYSDRQEIFDAIAVRELDAFRAGIERAFTARQLIFSPRNMASIRDWRPDSCASLMSNLRVSSVMRFFE